MMIECQGCSGHYVLLYQRNGQPVPLWHLGPIAVWRRRHPAAAAVPGTGS